MKALHDMSETFGNPETAEKVREHRQSSVFGRTHTMAKQMAGVQSTIQRRNSRRDSIRIDLQSMNYRQSNETNLPVLGLTQSADRNLELA